MNKREVVAKMSVANPMEFLNTMVKSLPKFQKQFVWEMVAGLVRSQSVLLSEIGRALQEPIALSHTERRLSRNLSDVDLSKLIRTHYLQEVAKEIEMETLIAIDIGEISKLYSKHQSNLCWVRDGSCPEEDKIRRGWWLFEAEAMNGERHLPLQLELWSTKTRKFRSQNIVVRDLLENLISHLGERGIYLLDRGFDSDSYYTFFESRACRYVIRCEGRRHVCPASEPFRPRAVERWMDFVPLSDWFWKWEHPKKKREHTIHVGYRQVVLPNTGQMATLIVGSDPSGWKLFLLTNCKVESDHSALRFLKAYLKRWGCEEAARATKQIFDLENIRVQSWQSLQNMVRLVLLSWAYLCWVARKTPKSILHFLLSSVPSFKAHTQIRFLYYRLARALRSRILIPPKEVSIRV